MANALEARSPKARYFVGTDRRVATPAMLPDWVQDSLVLRVLGQNKTQDFGF